MDHRNIKDFPSWSAGQLKCRAFSCLVFGILPFEQWGAYIASHTFGPYPALRAKAFSVWFPTMVDFLKNEGEWKILSSEFAIRKIDMNRLFELLDELKLHFQSVLSLYSKEEQFFIRDRRLQNVHGHISTFVQDEHQIEWFNSKENVIQKETLTSEAYSPILKGFYPDITKATLHLIDRFIKSGKFTDLETLYGTKLKTNPHLIKLLMDFGISGEVAEQAS